MSELNTRWLCNYRALTQAWGRIPIWAKCRPLLSRLKDRSVWMYYTLETLSSSIYQWRQQAKVANTSSRQFVMLMDATKTESTGHQQNFSKKSCFCFAFCSLSPPKGVLSAWFPCVNMKKDALQKVLLCGGKSSKSQINGSFKERTHSSCLALSRRGFMMLLFFFSCKSWPQHWGQLHSIPVHSSKGGKLKKIWGQRKKKARLKQHLRKWTSTQTWTSVDVWIDTLKSWMSKLFSAAFTFNYCWIGIFSFFNI